MVSSKVPSRSNNTAAKRHENPVLLGNGRFALDDFGPHGVNNHFVVGLAENGGTCHKGIGACGAYGGDIVDLDPAVDFQRNALAAVIFPGVDFLRRACASLASVPGMKLWPPKPGLTDMSSTTSSLSMT